MKTNYSNEEIFSMQRELDEKRRQYEWDGGEITPEDSITLLNIMSNGLPKDEAVDVVLNGIYEVISQGYDD